MVNSLPSNKILEWSKLKAFANNENNCGLKIEFCFGKIRKIVRKGENAGYQHFLLSHNVFKSPLLQGR